MLAELKRLLGEATPTGWIADDGEYEGYLSHDNTAEYATLFRPGPNNHRAGADARLIAAAVNALPRLIAVVEAAREWDGICDENCARKRARADGGCTCGAEGLRRALAALEEVPRG